MKLMLRMDLDQMIARFNLSRTEANELASHLDRTVDAMGSIRARMSVDETDKLFQVALDELHRALEVLPDHGSDPTGIRASIDNLEEFFSSVAEERRKSESTWSKIKRAIGGR